MKRPGIEVVCLIFNRKDQDIAADQIAEKLLKAGITTHRGYYFRPWEKNIFRKILTITETGRFDIIHSHLKYADFWISILKFSKKLTIPVVSTLHGYNDKYQGKYGLNIRNSLFFSLYYRVTKFIFKRLDGFIAISNVVYQFFSKSRLIINKPVEIIYHGYNTDGVIQQKKISRKGEITNPRFALPGRFTKFKGHKYAIQSFNEILKTYPGATMDFFGAGPEEDALKKQVEEHGLSDKISFVGYSNNIINDLFEYDVVLLPSISEPFGAVFLDSFSAGTPVVAFDMPAGNEIIVNNFNGLLVKAMDTSAMADAAIRLCKDAALREIVTKNAVDVLYEKFNLTSQISSYLNFYQKIIKAKRSD